MHLIEKQLQDFLITLAEEQSSFINLFGTGGDTLIPLSFLDQILSAEFLSTRLKSIESKIALKCSYKSILKMFKILTSLNS